jgi:hypothetical protein
VREVQELAESVSYRTLRNKSRLCDQTPEYSPITAPSSRAQNDLVCDKRGSELARNGNREGPGKLAEPPDKEPLPKRLPFRSLDGEIDRDAEERVSKPIVRADSAAMIRRKLTWHVLMSVLSTYGRRVIHFINAYPSQGSLESGKLTNDGGGDYRIGWGEAGRYGQAG